MRRHGGAVVGGFLAAGIAAACDGGQETGATCPPDSTLTWETFGETFMSAWCVDCHSGFADPVRVRRDAGEIDRVAGAGPNGVNTEMPEGQLKPTLQEREALATWLACGAP